MDWSVSASHIPVLIGLNILFPMHSVLEFGPGQYSTCTFLDKEAFPDLEKLDSIEDDPSWFRKFHRDIKDPRFHLFKEDFEYDYGHYDTVFVDGPQLEAYRVGVIRSVTSNIHSNKLLVIHDIQHPWYKDALSARIGDWSSYIFDYVDPYTFVCRKEDPLPIDVFQKFNEFMKENFEKIGPNLSQWRRFLTEVYSAAVASRSNS